MPEYHGLKIDFTGSFSSIYCIGACLAHSAHSIGAFILYAKAHNGIIVPLVAVPNEAGDYVLKVDTEITATLDLSGLATSDKQDDIMELLGIGSNPASSSLQGQGIVIAAALDPGSGDTPAECLHSLLQYFGADTQNINIDTDLGNVINQTIIPAPEAGNRLVITAIEFSALAFVEVAAYPGSDIIRIWRGLVIVPKCPLVLGEVDAFKFIAMSNDRITGVISYFVEAV